MDYNTKYKIYSDLDDLKERTSKLYLYLGKKLPEANEDDFQQIAKIQSMLNDIKSNIDSSELSKEPKVK